MSPSELLYEIGGSLRGYGHTENRVRLVRMHAHATRVGKLNAQLVLNNAGASEDTCSSKSSLPPSFLRQAHGRQAEQGRSCRVGHRAECQCQAVVDRDSEQPPNEIRRLYQDIHQPVSLENAKCLEVARLLGTLSLLLKEGRMRLAFGPSLIEGRVKSTRWASWRSVARY